MLFCKHQMENVKNVALFPGRGCFNKPQRFSFCISNEVICKSPKCSWFVGISNQLKTVGKQGCDISKRFFLTTKHLWTTFGVWHTVPMAIVPTPVTTYYSCTADSHAVRLLSFQRKKHQNLTLNFQVFFSVVCTYLSLCVSSLLFRL